MKNIGLKYFLFTILICGINFFPFISSADSQIISQEEEIGFEMIPNNPDPYEKVTIKLYSYTIDIDKASITWQNNSGIIKSGIGDKKHVFNAPGADSTIYFDIFIKPAQQSLSIKKRITINPSDIDIIWESIDGYSPPFYKGKSMPTKGSMLKVVAIPNSNTITSKSGQIDYTWKNNNKTIEEASGYNKNAYIFKNSLFDTINNLEVEASSVSGNYNAQKEIEIPVYDPSLVFYKKSPTDGILFNKGIIEDFFMREDQVTFFSSPYNLALIGNENLFNYEWKANDKTLSITPSKKNEITIRPNSRDGYVKLELKIENLNELFQDISRVFKIIL